MEQRFELLLKNISLESSLPAATKKVPNQQEKISLLVSWFAIVQDSGLPDSYLGIISGMNLR